MPLKGSCHCGAIAYEVDRLSGVIGHCFCVTCRKTHAAASKPNARVKADAFRWIRGEELLTDYRSSPEKARRFCSRCGCHVIAASDKKACRNQEQACNHDSLCSGRAYY